MKQAFQIIPNFIDKHTINILYHYFHYFHCNTNLTALGQTGIELEQTPKFNNVLETFQPNMKLTTSSSRLQKPNTKGSLALHQDDCLLGDHIDTSQMVVIWVPLVPIDEFTPSLEVCPILPKVRYKHKSDNVEYTVLDIVTHSPLLEMPLLAISKMNLGDVLILSPLTLHRSYVRPWHIKERLSLDLRFLPKHTTMRQMRINVHKNYINFKCKVANYVKATKGS